MKVLIYSLAILFGIGELLLALWIGGGSAPSGLSEQEFFQYVRVPLLMAGLGSFLMLVGGVTGLLKKNWAKILVIIGCIFVIGSYISSGNVVSSWIYVAIALFVFLKG